MTNSAYHWPPQTDFFWTRCKFRLVPDLASWGAAPTIDLHSERVKLRMVQPLDRIKIVHAEVRGLLVARSMEVQPRFPSSGGRARTEQE